MLRNAYYQQITAQAQQRQADAAQTALFLQHQQREGATGLKFTHDLLECIAMAQGMQDGFAGLELEPSPEYMKTSRGCIQNFCTSIPIPFSAFDGIRRTKHTVELTRDQEESVMRSFDKLVGADEKNSPTKTKDISIPLPFVSVFFSQRCPELRGSFGKTTPSGATYLLLSVVTGHAGLCGRCLKAGANPNNLTFLQDSQKPSGEMFHGYSPMFMAVLAEQIGIMDLLHGCGGSVHVYDRWGRTPLHAAVAMNSVEVVQWLMAKGAPRYVGDCLNLIPAESSEEDYFPELAMPNLALYGQPKPPSMEQLSASIAVTCGETAPAWSGVDEGSALAAASGSNTTTAEASSKPAGSEEGRREVHCHCRSGLGIGFCGCVDDMYQRWTVDRLRTTWSPGVNYYNLMLQQGESAAGGAQ